MIAESAVLNLKALVLVWSSLKQHRQPVPKYWRIDLRPSLCTQVSGSTTRITSSLAAEDVDPSVDAHGDMSQSYLTGIQLVFLNILLLRNKYFHSANSFA